MKGGVILIAGGIAMMIVIMISIAIVVCLVPGNKETTLCAPVKPIIDIMDVFF